MSFPQRLTTNVSWAHVSTSMLEATQSERNQLAPVKAQKEPTQDSGRCKPNSQGLSSMVRNFFIRAYVPLATLLLTVVVTTLLARWSRQFDPLAAVLDLHLKTQGRVDTPSSAAGVLGRNEEVRAVLNPDRVVDPEREQLLYLGNSQTTMIVDPGPADLVTAQWLQVLLERRGMPVAVHLAGAANMTMPEIFLRLLAGAEQRPREADVAVVAAGIEEFRDTGIRDEIAALAKDPAVKARLEQLCRDNPDLLYAATAIKALLSPPPATAVAAEPASPAFAQRVESRLQKAADQWPFLAQREKLNGKIVLTYLRVRECVFGVTPELRRVQETVRGENRTRFYAANLQLLELVCRYARAQGIRLILYLGPVRDIKPGPNASEDLEQLPRDVPRLCRQYGVRFLNYADLVPADLWSKHAVIITSLRAGAAGQPDFVHLTGAGHRLLAERLLSDIGAQLIAAPPVQAQVRHP